MLVKVHGCALQGLDGLTITIEVSVTEGMKYYMVGLPDSAIRESWQRVESALRESGFQMPRRKVVINLAPADVRKEGSAYDLPIAIGILIASGQLNPTMPLDEWIIMGELSLDGTLQPIRGALPIALHARQHGFTRLLLPEKNAREAGILDGIQVFGARTLREVADFLRGELRLSSVHVDPEAILRAAHEQAYQVDFADVRGQEYVKRALVVAAAGGHNVLMIGPPGAGKSMLAQRLVTILPSFTLEEALETTKIYSIAGLLPPGQSLITSRPFRAPHHTISDVALVGGGVPPQPGEISLAHNGVLFLDELPEFKRSVLEVLRQPLETREIVISRAKHTVRFPANFTLVAAMNPCPCGYYNHPQKPCQCTPGMIRRYISRLSGPLLDRIDIHLEVVPVPIQELHTQKGGITSRELRARVEEARARQRHRFQSLGVPLYCNSQLSPSLLRKVCTLTESSLQLLKTAVERYQLSTRAHDRILKIARTLADLDGKDTIEPIHIAEAIQYRILDKPLWGEGVSA